MSTCGNDVGVVLLGVAVIGLSLGFVGLVYCGYMLFRNHRIFAYREYLRNYDWESYQRLPSYDDMMRKFWVWPLRRFLKEPR